MYDIIGIQMLGSRVPGGCLDDLNMPGLKANTEVVFLGVAQTHIIEILELLENICSGKPSGEIVASKPDTAHVKITDSVKRITGRG